MFCSKCGSSNDVEAKFCKSCGAQLNGNSGAQPVAVSESPEVVYAGLGRGSNRKNWLLLVGGIFLLMLIGVGISTLVPKYVTHRENATVIPAHIPEGAVSTRFGLLQVKDNAGKKELLLLPSTLIYQEEVDYLSIGQVFKVGDSDAVLVSATCGGAACVPSYFFITFQANSKPILSPQFTPNVGEVKPVQKGDTVTIDLGWRDGFQETLVYETGKISMQRQVSTKKARADVADCDYLYQEIYLPYVQERWCHTNPDSPMLAASMAQLRGYEALANDSRLNIDFFRKLSQFSCETQQAIAYEQFQQQVCGH